MLATIRAYFKAKHPEFVDQDNFIFGADESTLKSRIEALQSYYMFVDYGAFDSTVDSNNRIVDTFELAVTIAMPVGANSPTPAKIEEYQIVSFQKIAELRAVMLKEQRENPWLKHLDSSHQILPFFAPDLSRSIGNTLAFKMQGYDLLNAKG